MKNRAALPVVALLIATLAPALSHGAGATDVAGIPASFVGQHGPTIDYASNLDLVGKTSMVPANSTTGKPLGNNAAVGLIGDCAYVGRWHDYAGKFPVQIVDIADPANPVSVGAVPGTSINGSTARELRTIDLPNFKLLTIQQFAQAAGSRTGNLLQFFTFPSGDCRTPVLAGTFDLRAITPHEFFQWLDPVHSVNGHPRILEFVTSPLSPTNIVVVDASDPANPLPAGGYNDGEPIVSPNESYNTYLGTYAHSISLSPDGKEAYISYWDGGFFTMDTSSFAAGLGAGAFVPKGAMSVPQTTGLNPVGNTHSAVMIPGKRIAVVGDEDYSTADGCPFGWMHVLDVGDTTTQAHAISEFKLPENAQLCDTTTKRITDTNSNGDVIDGTFSMHNQTVTPHYVVTSWYGGGLRIIDVSDPAAPAEAAFFVPKPLDVAPASNPNTSLPTFGAGATGWQVQTWSYPVIRNGLIYVVDTRNGLYILKPSASAPQLLQDEIASTKFAEGNSNFGSFAG